jgi:hypothetical protein
VRKRGGGEGREEGREEEEERGGGGKRITMLHNLSMSQQEKLNASIGREAINAFHA